MRRKTTTFAAIAGLALATTMFPTGSNAVALAEAATEHLTAPAPAPELVPGDIAFVSEPLVQPLETPAASTPTLTEAGSLEELVGMVDTAEPMSAEMRCLAGAVYFEARGEELAGQLAVAQVIVNRTEDGRFPKSYCGVVTQPGQFSFMKGARMPKVRESSPAWTRAVAIAHIAHQGLWEQQAGDAVFFHAARVRPGWSAGKTRLAQIDTHIFYR
ncbi:cell wall hydrolase [Erythrobacter sp. NE805]|uniref:cell wall hydrolase n=1 Tax=Erythrobacter sp. NE805 TaxID=3389875 RepID=UPI00396B48A6